MKITPWKHVDLGDLTGIATMEGRSKYPSVFEEKNQNQPGHLYLLPSRTSRMIEGKTHTERDIHTERETQTL